MVNKKQARAVGTTLPGPARENALYLVLPGSRRALRAIARPRLERETNIHPQGRSRQVFRFGDFVKHESSKKFLLDKFFEMC